MPLITLIVLITMENSYISPATEIICAACEGSASENDSFCNHCGYPIQGTAEEQRSFLGIRNNHLIDLEEQEKKIKNATNALYWIGGMTVVMGLILMASAPDSEKADILITNLVLAALYVSLGIWSRKKPMAAIVTGFSVFILVNILNMFIDPLYLVKGIIMKVIVIGIFIKAIKAVVEAEKIKKEHNF